MNYTKGDYVIYRNGEKYEIGRIASIRHDGAFVCYHEGETASKTSYDRMHKLINAYVIKRTTLGASRFDEEQPEIIRCMDCKHWKEGTVFSYCNKLHEMGVLDVLEYMTAEDDFCSKAERRE